ncbi:hypothetical protein, partial [Aeromonas salmonicida]
WGMIVASWCVGGGVWGRVPTKMCYILTGGQRVLLACKVKHYLWVIFIWRRALAPCIARHFIHPERREGWYYRVSNHFFKAY